MAGVGEYTIADLAELFSVSASRRVLPMPASPSARTTARRPAAARFRARLSTPVSASRPRRPGIGAVAAMGGWYR